MDLLVCQAESQTLEAPISLLQDFNCVIIQLDNGLLSIHESLMKVAAITLHNSGICKDLVRNKHAGIPIFDPCNAQIWETLLEQHCQRLACSLGSCHSQAVSLSICSFKTIPIKLVQWHPDTGGRIKAL